MFLFFVASCRIVLLYWRQTFHGITTVFSVLWCPALWFTVLLLVYRRFDTGRFDRNWSSFVPKVNWKKYPNRIRQWSIERISSHYVVVHCVVVHCVVVHYVVVHCVVVHVLWFTVSWFTVSWLLCCRSLCCGYRVVGERPKPSSRRVQRKTGDDSTKL